MRLKTVIPFLAAAGLLWAGGTAQGGVVRYVGKKMQAPGRVAASAMDTAGAGVTTAGKSTTGVLGRGLQVTKHAAGATAGAVETGAGATKHGVASTVGTAGSAAAGAVKTGAAATKDGTLTVAKGAKAAPGVVAEGAKSVAGGIKRVIW